MAIFWSSSSCAVFLVFSLLPLSQSQRLLCHNTKPRPKPVLLTKITLRREQYSSNTTQIDFHLVCIFITYTLATVCVMCKGRQFKTAIIVVLAVWRHTDPSEPDDKNLSQSPAWRSPLFWGLRRIKGECWWPKGLSSVTLSLIIMRQIHSTLKDQDRIGLSIIHGWQEGPEMSCIKFMNES